MKFALLYTAAGLDSPFVVNIDDVGEETPEEIVKAMMDEIKDCTHDDAGDSKDIEILNTFKDTIIAWVKACISARSVLHISLSTGATKIAIYAQTDLKAEGICRGQ